MPTQPTLALPLLLPHSPQRPNQEKNYVSKTIDQGKGKQHRRTAAKPVPIKAWRESKAKERNPKRAIAIRPKQRTRNREEKNKKERREANGKGRKDERRRGMDKNE